MRDLLPCLKCGSEIIGLEVLYTSNGRPEPMHYTCKNGHAWDEWYDSESEAAEAWNTRPGYKWKTFEEWKLVLNAMGLSVKDEHPEDIWNAAREMKEEK